MDIKEIINRPYKEPVTLDEIKLVIDFYILQKKGVHFNLMIPRTALEWMVWSEKLIYAFNKACFELKKMIDGN